VFVDAASNPSRGVGGVLGHVRTGSGQLGASARRLSDVLLSPRIATFKNGAKQIIIESRFYIPFLFHYTELLDEILIQPSVGSSGDSF
jgi:hypothetical protein